MALRGGGTVTVPAGTYRLQDALHLRDGVHLVGEPGAILCPAIPQRSSPLTQVAGYGFHEFFVRDPELFDVGMGVLIMDDNAHGFYMTAATIVGRCGDAFYTDCPMSHDYKPTARGQVVAAFSIIRGVGVHNASARGLRLTGYPGEAFCELTANGCRNAGVFLLRAHGITLEDLEITAYNGDGISFQQCSDIRVIGCRIHDNHGGGIHPGSGTVRYVLRNNTIANNSGHGIFYCLRTTHSLCENNTIRNNHSDGISVGERDTHHILRGNTISENSGAGLIFREPVAQSGDAVLVESNRLTHNGSPIAEAIVSAGLRDIHFSGNVFEPHSAIPALHIGKGCQNIGIGPNRVGTRPLESSDLSGSGEGIRIPAESANLPPLGPEAATDIRHLGVPSLPAQFQDV